MNKFCTLLGFDPEKKKTSVKTEIVAGIVTFLAMAYILTLNPSLITNDWTRSGVLWPSVFIATALGAFVGTILMAFLAKLPLAQAPGLGLNSMVGGLLGGSLGFACSFGNAMLLVLISGVLFLLLSIITVKGVSIRELIYDGIPECVRGSISVGIGLFIAFIGLVNAGIIVPGQSSVDLGELGAFLIPGTGTLVDVVKFSSWDMSVIGGALVCLIGFIVIAVLSHFNVKGAVIIGIAVGTVIGIPLGVTTWSGYTWEFWTYFENFFSFEASEGGTFFSAFTEGFSWDKNALLMPCIMTVITFCMIDMFDTMGTCVGCCEAAGLMENGKPLYYNKIMYSDSFATCAGALFGTSTVTTFVESGAGIAAGGKTGLTALTTAILFLLSIFLLPIFASIPTSAAASALLWVGALMLKGAKNIKIDGVKNFVPAFLTIAMMPLGYSITDGIGFGILSYVLIDVFGYLCSLIAYKFGKGKEGEEKVKPVWDLHVVTIIIAVLFIIYFFVPTSF